MWRQVRNFVLDIRQIPTGSAHCLHWQVAQGASLQNIVFEMIEGGDGNQQMVSLHKMNRNLYDLSSLGCFHGQWISLISGRPHLQRWIYRLLLWQPAIYLSKFDLQQLSDCHLPELELDVFL